MKRNTTPSFGLYIFLTLTFFAVGISAQNSGESFAAPVKTDLKATLYILIGSKETTGKVTLPTELRSISEEINAGWNYPVLRSGGMQVLRIEAPGHFKSRVSLDISNGEANIPVSSLEWSINFARSTVNLTSGEPVRLGNTVFSLRTPLMTRAEDDAKEVFGGYETFTTAISGLSIRTGKPELVGTLSLPSSDDTAFFILKFDILTGN